MLNAVALGTLVEASVRTLPGVAHLYAPTSVKSVMVGTRVGVVEHPTQRVAIAIGVNASDDSRLVAAAAASAIRASLPTDWRGCEVLVRVARLH